MKRSILYTYRQKLFVSFIVLLIFIIAAVSVFQHFNEKNLKTKQLQENLINYAHIIAKAIPLSNEKMDSFVTLFPEKLRITIIANDGHVIYDNMVKDDDTMENHLLRPEIQQALSNGEGYYTRHSKTLKQDYYYVAIKQEHFLVRTSMAYALDLDRTQLKLDRLFAYFIIALFATIILFLFLITNRLSLSIEALRNFSHQKEPHNTPTFPEGELGDIGRRISELYAKNINQKERLQQEKDKLIKHFHYSDKGIAIFSCDKSLIYNNSLFVQYAGFISPDNFEISKILDNKEFNTISDFLIHKKKTSFSEVVSVGERAFEIKAIIFDDHSFEIMISDISLADKNRRIKRDMTQNIAHELKTPVSTIRGYLETLQTLKVSPEKQQHFLQRAKLQADRLSELVTDIAMITKMEESPNLYPKEEIILNEIIEQATDSSKLKVHLDLPNNIKVWGSRNLAHTVFQNLIDNANRYAGNAAEIFISCYLQDEQYYYFSVYDTGVGVPDKYLNRIFERFYRIDEGRNRNNGGTGLGLSLVKNAILMHNGDIQAKNRENGGLKFLFTIKKK